MDSFVSRPENLYTHYDLVSVTLFKGDYPKMRVRKPRRIDEYLEGLADFLNTAHSDVAEKEWRLFLKRIERTAIGSYFHAYVIDSMKSKRARHLDRITLQEAKDIRTEMHHDALVYLHSNKELRSPYAGLVACLNELELKTQYQCTSEKFYGKPLHGQAILRSHGNRWVARVWPLAKTTKELLYTILAEALVNSTLNRLKVCKQCGKYLAVKDRKRDFCPGTSCKDDFFNRQKSKDGTFKTARRKRKLLEQHS